MSHETEEETVGTGDSDVAVPTDGIDEIFDVAVIRARQKRVERFTLGIVVLFLFSLATAYVLTEGKVVDDPAMVLRGFGGGVAKQTQQINCEEKQNLRMKVCQERATEKESNWRSIVRFVDGKSNAFSVHGGGD